MLPLIPQDGDDPAHVAHVFGDSLDGAEAGPAKAEQTWTQLDSTTIEDWQALFVRAYSGRSGAA
jgi:hypothetical protein